MASTGGSNPATTIHTQIRTTFLISNLHCPSYVSNIRNALFVLHPRPISVSPSIVSQLVTVHHDPLLLESTISRALEEAGFEIDSVIQDTAASTGPIYYFSNERNCGEGDGWLGKVIKGRILNCGPVKKLEEKKKDKHVAYCDLCRAGKGEKANAKGMSSSTSFDQRSGEHDD
jgi:P-type Cu+ transporter